MSLRTKILNLIEEEIQISLEDQDILVQLDDLLDQIYDYSDHEADDIYEPQETDNEEVPFEFLDPDRFSNEDL